MAQLMIIPGKQFVIAYSSSKSLARVNKLSKQEATVNYSQLTKRIQSIHKSGGSIISITES